MKRGISWLHILTIFFIMLFFTAGPALAAATYLEVTGAPASATAGVPFDLTVTAKNPDTSTDTGYTGTVYFSSSAAAATLPAPYTFVTGDNGTKTFSVSLGTAGSQTIYINELGYQLAGHWKLDEGSGILAADSTIFGQNGTITGSTWSSSVPAVLFPDPFSLSFTGATNVVTINKAPPLRWTSGTVAAWIRAGTDTTNFSIILSDEAASKGFTFYLQPTGELSVQFNTDTPSQVYYRTDGIFLKDDSWHHVAVVIDNTAKTSVLYVDGVQRGSTTFTGNFVAATSAQMLAGQFVGGVGLYPFLGLLDDLRSYQRPLSVGEIAALAAGNTGGGIFGNSSPVTVNAAAPGAIATVAGTTPQGALPTTAYAIQLQAKVTDSYGNPLAGVAVNFAAPAAGLYGTFTGGLSSVDVATDGSGIATAPVFTASSVLGSFVVNATTPGVGSQAQFNLANYLAPVITAQPQPVTIIAGQVPNVSVTVGTNGTPPLAYQWYQGTSGDTSIPVTGAVSATFDQPLTSTVSLWVRITKYVTTLDSAAAMVTVMQPPAITVPPQHALMQNGQSTTLTVTATGDGTLTYQWYEGASGDTSRPIAGATATTFITPPFTTPTWYWVRIVNIYGQAASSAARVTGTAFGPFAYVPAYAGNTLSVIELASNVMVANLPLPGISPAAGAVTADGSRLYVPFNNGNVAVIDTATASVIATIPAAGTLRGAALSPDESRLYVADYSAANRLYVIDTATNSVSATIALSSQPYDLRVSPDGSRLYITTFNGTTVSIVDRTDYSLVGTVTGVGTAPYGIAVSPDGSHIYTANNTGGSISVIDTATATVTATVPVGSSPWGIAISPDGSRVYNANANSGTVSVLETTGNTVVATITVGTGPVGVSVSPDGSRLYVTNQSSSTVSVIDTASNTVLTTIPVGIGPRPLGRFIPWDTSPDPFAFAPQTGVTPEATITSAPVVISGIDVPVYIGVSGGEYSVNGGSFTATPGLVRSGDQVAVRLVAPSGYNSITSARVTISGRSATFSVTTPPEPGGVPVAVVTFAPAGLVFADRLTGTTGSRQTVTVTNSGSTPLYLGTITLGGANAGDFAFNGNTCTAGLTIPAGGSCTIGATFTPSAPGGRNAVVNIVDSAAGSPHLVPLFGGGLEVGLVLAPPETYINATAMTIPSTGAATPYPSTINVAGSIASLSNVRVTLTGVNHTWPSDIGVLLVGPQGQNVVLMTGAGSGTDIVNVNLAFDDAAASSLTTAAIVSGTYKPTDLGTTQIFPAPAPTRPYGTTLAGFAGTYPNGDWKLYVYDSTSGDLGSISGGWQLELTGYTANDITPDPFSFAPQGTPSASTLVDSAPAVLTGLNTISPISISAGGEYAVSTDSGASWSLWSTTVPANVNPNDQVKVRVASGTTQGQVTSTTLTIGGVNATFSVILSDTTVPTVDTFAIPATSTSTTVPVPVFTASDNVGVTGWMITASATPPAAGDPGWRTIRPPEVILGSDGLHTLHAWVKDAAGNVSAASSAATATVTVTTVPIIVLSALSHGSTTSNPVVNLAGTVTDPDGIATFTINGVNTPLTNGRFSAALKLPAGASSITLVATDTASHFTTVTRTITYDPAAPELSVPYPADQSSLNLNSHPTVAVEGNFDPATASTILVAVNGAAPQEAMTAGNGFLHYATLVDGINTIEISAVGSVKTNRVKRTIFAGADLLDLMVALPVEDFFAPVTSYLLSGTVAGNAGPVTLTVNADGVISNPAVTAGAFEKLLNFPTEKSYPVTITAIDGLGRSATLKRTIIRQKYDQTITFNLTSPVNFSATPIVLSATSSCGLPVSFSSSAPTVATVSGSILTLTGGGDTTITASQAGNATCKAASVARTLHVNTGTQYTLVVDFAGTGQGGVLYTEQGEAFNTDRTVLVNPGAHVTLVPYQDQYSLFSGWSGACTNSSGNCSLTMTGNKTATATFTFDAPHSVQINLPLANYYSTVLSAYQAASSGATMKIWGVDFSEAFTFGLNKAIKVEAGYSGSWGDNSGTTTLSAPMKIRNGKIGISKGAVKVK